MLESEQRRRVHGGTQEYEYQERRYRTLGRVTVATDQHQQIWKETRPGPVDTRGQPHANFLDCNRVGLYRTTTFTKHSGQLLVRLRAETVRIGDAFRKLASQPADATAREVAATNVANARIGRAIDIEVTIGGPTGLDFIQDCCHPRAGQQEPTLHRSRRFSGRRLVPVVIQRADVAERQRIRNARLLQIDGNRPSFS